MPIGLAGELPGPEALVGDGAVAVGLARAHVEVGPHDAPVHREEQRDGHLGDGVGVAAGRPQHGDALLGGGGDVDVGGVAPARADGDERQVEHRALDAVGLHDQQVGALGLDPGGQVVGVVEPQRLVVDPGIEHDVGDGAEGARGPDRGTVRSRGRDGVRSWRDSGSRDRFDPTRPSTGALSAQGSRACTPTRTREASAAWSRRLPTVEHHDAPRSEAPDPSDRGFRTRPGSSTTAISSCLVVVVDNEC